MLVGLGRHTQDIYYPLLERSPRRPRVGCVVELSSRREAVEAFLGGRELRPERILYLEGPDAEAGTPALRRALASAVAEHRIGGVLVATPPEHHLRYALWGAEAGLHLLVDKPLTTRTGVLYDEAQAQGLLDDYDALLRAVEAHPEDRRPTCLVASHRRYHPAWLLMRRLVAEVAERTRCPVTAVNGEYSDGEWRLPHDVLNQDYHPYNLGFGILSHSGYHLIDSVVQLIAASRCPGKEVDALEVSTAVVRPQDQLSQIGLADYLRLFPGEEFRRRNPYTQEEFRARCEGFGEVDAFVTAQFLRGADAVTTATIQLQHNSLSHRGWVDVGDRNLYQGNGRLRHEHYVVRQGPFQMIRLTSLQSTKASQGARADLETGGKNHLEIFVFRNRELFGEAEAFRRYGPEELELDLVTFGSHLEAAKRLLLDEFIRVVSGERLPVASSLRSHAPSIALLSRIYRAAARRLTGGPPLARAPYTFAPALTPGPAGPP